MTESIWQIWQFGALNKPKELWKTLKSLGLSSGKAIQSKMSLNKDGAIQFEPLEKSNTFKRFYFELAGGLQGKLPRAPNKFTGQTTKNYYAKTSCNISNDFEFSNLSEEHFKRFYLVSIPVKLLELTKYQQNF